MKVILFCLYFEMQDISNINSLTCIHLKTTCFRTRKLRTVYTNMKEEWDVMLAFRLFFFKQEDFEALTVSPNFIEVSIKGCINSKVCNTRFLWKHGNPCSLGGRLCNLPIQYFLYFNSLLSETAKNA